MSRWRTWWLAATSLVALLATGWLRAPLWLFALPAAVAALAAGAAVLAPNRAGSGLAERHRAPRLPVFGAVVATALALLLLGVSWRLRRIERAWPDVREAKVVAASRKLGGELATAVALARRLADRGAALLALRGPAAFDGLRRAARGPRTPAHAVVLFDAGGRPVAWSGSQRYPVGAAGPELAAVTTPFYVVLEARRQAAGGTAVGVVWLASTFRARASHGSDGAEAEAAADWERRVDGGQPLADRFRAATGVGLRFYQPWVAPRGPDVFDYVEARGTAVEDTLFTVIPVPPAQAAVRRATLLRARRAGVLLVAVLVVIAILGATDAARPGQSAGAEGPAAVAGPGVPRPLRRLVLALPVVVLAAMPFGAVFDDASLFSSAFYHRPLLGPFSSSAGSLGLAAALGVLAAISLWQRGLRPTPARRVVALGIALWAPFFLRELARGITPPAEGISVGLWLSWQIGLMLSAAAAILVAAALVRGERAPTTSGVAPWLAGGLAVAAAVLGLWLWLPETAWPVWYPYLWLPALLLLLRPMRLRALLVAAAVVAGTAAGLLTWGSTAARRLALAERDVEGLGRRGDPLAAVLADRFVHESRFEPAPASAGDLYRLWENGALGAAGYPAALAIWSPGGERTLSLSLADLDLPAALLRAAAREAGEDGLPLLRSYARIPGVHRVAAIPLASGEVLTVGVGPRSLLVRPSRLAQLLAGSFEQGEPPYRLALTAPGPAEAEASARVLWRREGWTVRGERFVEFPDGMRHVHAAIDLRGPGALLQRGFLVLALDLLVIGALWLVLEAAGGRIRPAIAREWPRARDSFRVRLTLALALFFVVPTLVFAAWGFARFGEEFRRARELLVRQTLRDAGAALGADPRESAAAVDEAARRVNAELLLFRGGTLEAASAPALVDLGVVDRLVPPAVFTRLAFGDEIEVSWDEPRAPGRMLVGYRLVRPGRAAETTILAAPEALSDELWRRRESDIGVAVLVAMTLGVLAALVLSGLAARALAEPIQALRRAAQAVGSGEGGGPGGPLALTGRPPTEFGPVYAAFEQMAADVEAGRQAQRVLAWGEMARQVAHEIKNPLTPIRLGIQHLLRLQRERPADLAPALDATGRRILAEIERLDAIARAFSRFALPTAERPPLVAVDPGEVANQVVALYRLGETPVAWEVRAESGLEVLARRDELAEVLVNLFENSRDAGARRVVVDVRASGRPAAAPSEPGGPGGETTLGCVIEVRDDGRGIPAAALPHVFEPRFSTTTSGSGLGLAIAERLVRGWGGEIVLASAEGEGTMVTLRLAGTERAG